LVILPIEFIVINRYVINNPSSILYIYDYKLKGGFITLRLDKHFFISRAFTVFKTFHLREGKYYA